MNSSYLLWHASRDLATPTFSAAPWMTPESNPGKKGKKSKNPKPEETRAIVPVSSFTEQYGDFELIQSKFVSNRTFTALSSLSAKTLGKPGNDHIWVRARVHTVRQKGKSAFLLLRYGTHTIQAAIFASDEIPREMVKYIGKIPTESIVEIYGKPVATPSKITSATQSDVEIQISKIFVISASSNNLPLQLADAMQPEADNDLGDSSQVATDDKGRATVGRAVRLDNRVLDLRTPANHAIFKLQSRVGQYFRQFFIDRDFIEVHTPKIIGAASEGGSDVFKLKYFGKDAFLAQSPQLYKQMCVVSDLHRVFEVGPVFRSENSNTYRHLCEFTGLDFEMEIREHYHEVLRVLSDLFHYIFGRITAECGEELAAINAQYPFEPLQYDAENALILHFSDAVEMLRAAGDSTADPQKDFSTEQEKFLGKLVKAKYGQDFYIVDQYPMTARPFYTMPCAEDPTISNSYDVFLRGEEITSGAQRVHDVDLLVERALAQDPPIPLHTLQSYIDSFKYGAYPHGGAGIGLERVVMLYCGLGNIRKCSLFPRDPKRVMP